MTIHPTMTFGDALFHLKQGRAIARSGWNGKGMYLTLRFGEFDGPARGFVPGEIIEPSHPSTQDGISVSLFKSGPKETPLVLPTIVMRTATGATLIGWLASQSDMLANDWVLVPLSAVDAGTA